MSKSLPCFLSVGKLPGSVLPGPGCDDGVVFRLGVALVSNSAACFADESCFADSDDCEDEDGDDLFGLFVELPKDVGLVLDRLLLYRAHCVAAWGTSEGASSGRALSVETALGRRRDIIMLCVFSLCRRDVGPQCFISCHDQIT